MSQAIKILLILLTFICCTESQNCSEFHTGKFELIDKRIGYHAIITRDKEHQIETNQKTGEVTEFLVEWIDDCTYVVTYLKTDNNELIPLIGKELTVVITDIKKSRVYFDSFMEGYDVKHSFHMTKIE